MNPYVLLAIEILKILLQGKWNLHGETVTASVKLLKAGDDIEKKKQIVQDLGDRWTGRAHDVDVPK